MILFQLFLLHLAAVMLFFFQRLIFFLRPEVVVASSPSCKCFKLNKSTQIGWNYSKREWSKPRFLPIWNVSNWFQLAFHSHIEHQSLGITCLQTEGKNVKIYMPVGCWFQFSRIKIKKNFFYLHYIMSFLLKKNEGRIVFICLLQSLKFLHFSAFFTDLKD